MANRALFFTLSILLLVASCIRIPDQAVTVGHFTGSTPLNTECLATVTTLADDTSATGLQKDGVNPLGFRLLIWNSYKGWSKTWQGDLDRLSSLSDVVVLQEAYLTEALQNMLDNKPFSWDIAEAFTLHNVKTGVLTAARVMPDFLCTFRTPEPLSKIPKTALITRYPFTGSDVYLVIVNIHMINFALDLRAYRAQLRKIVAVVSHHSGPLVITGDFNTWNDKRWKILAETMQELGLKEVDFAADRRTTFMEHTVDHIFYRKLKPLNAVTEKVNTSDHNPMLVTFRLDNDEA